MLEEVCMKLPKSIINFIFQRKVDKAGISFILLLFNNKEAIKQEVRKYTKITKSLDNTIKELLIVYPDIKIKKISNATIYQIYNKIEKDYVKLNFDEVIKLSIKEMYLALYLALYSFKNTINIDLAFVSQHFSSYQYFEKLMNRYNNIYSVEKTKKYNKVISYKLEKITNLAIIDNLNIDKDKVKSYIKENNLNTDNMYQEEFIQLDKKIKTLENIDKIKAIKRQEEIKLKIEYENKEKIINEIKANLDKYIEKINKLFINNQNSIEYIVYKKCLDNNINILENEFLKSYIYKNKDLILSN
jgi:hypothetical protein